MRLEILTSLEPHFNLILISFEVLNACLFEGKICKRKINVVSLHAEKKGTRIKEKEQLNLY